MGQALLALVAMVEMEGHLCLGGQNQGIKPWWAEATWHGGRALRALTGEGH